MTRAGDPSRALQSLRDVEVPVGARSRVRARIESQLDRRAIMDVPARRRWIVGVLAAPLVAMLLLALWPRSERRALSVAAGERHEVELASGHVSIHGPAEVAISRDQLSLVQGTVEAQGQLHVKGPSCDVVVQGAAEVSVTGAQLRVRVFAGSVQIVPPVITCEVIDLSPRRPITASDARKSAPRAASIAAPNESPIAARVGAGAPTAAPNESTTAARVGAGAPTAAPNESPTAARVGAGAPTAAPNESPTAARVGAGAPIAAPNESPTAARVGAGAPIAAPNASPSAARVEAAAPRATSLEPSPADPLADAVAAYHAAVALEARDLAAAREAWQAWRTRWPNSPLAQSVDLHLLAVLDRLGRHGEASDLARNFVRRYPRSPRRAEVQRLIVGAP